MWPKSIFVTSFIFIQILMIFQISYGKPTYEYPQNFHNTSSSSTNEESLLLDVIENRNNSSISPSYSETLTLTVPLTVLENETLDEESSFYLSSLGNASDDFATNSTSSSFTTEPEYYDDHNSTSSTLSELDELDPMSMHLGNGSTESSSLIIPTDEIELAGSLEESVTATLLSLKDENYHRQQFSRSVVNNLNDTNSMKSNSLLNININATTSSGDDEDDSSTQSFSAEDDADDSIIIASLSSNLNLDTVEPPDTSPSNEDGGGGDVSESTREMMLMNTDEMQTEVIISSSSESLSYSSLDSDEDHIHL